MSETNPAGDLSTELSRLALELDKLWSNTADDQERKKIRLVQKRVDDLLDPLIEANIAADNKQYSEAVATVSKAAEEVRNAKGDLQKVARAINTVAKVVGVVDKLLGIVPLG